MRGGLARHVAAWLDTHVPADEPVALAYSGGGDSHALLGLAVDWADRTGRPLHAFIVDHQLRAGSHRDAERAALMAARLGVRVHCLEWAGAKPSTGIQSAARTARYRMIAAGCRAIGASLLLTAHTADDQAETVLMRLASGSGWRGLAGMRERAAYPVWPDGYGLELGRPLLEVTRRQLREGLEASGESWIEDPANADRRFQRVRLRQRLTALRQHGWQSGRLIHLAAELRKLDAAEARAAGRLARQSLVIHAWGGIELDPDQLGAAVSVLRRRVLGEAMRAVSGAEARPTGQALECLETALLARRASVAAGVRLVTWRGAWWLVRDPGAVLGRVDRTAQPVVTDLGTGSIWDGRFIMSQLPTGMSVSALGRDYAGLDDRARLDAVPGAARSTLPALRHMEKVVAIGGLGANVEAAHLAPRSLAEHRICRELLTEN
ncbi:tRNA lysidine(34) synthetase TilS [Maricaulis sp. CAU 1757]